MSSVWTPGTVKAPPCGSGSVFTGEESSPDSSVPGRPAGKPCRRMPMDADGCSLCRGSAGGWEEKKKKSMDRKEGRVSSRRVVQQKKSCDCGDLRRVKIDSCWVINNSSAAALPFRQKGPENIPAAEKKHFLMKPRCVENNGAARNHAAGVETNFLWRRGREPLRLWLWSFHLLEQNDILTAFFYPLANFQGDFGTSGAFYFERITMLRCWKVLLASPAPRDLHPGLHWSQISCGLRSPLWRLSGGVRVQQETRKPAVTPQPPSFAISSPLSPIVLGQLTVPRKNRKHMSESRRGAADGAVMDPDKAVNRG